MISVCCTEPSHTSTVAASWSETGNTPFLESLLANCWVKCGFFQSKKLKSVEWLYHDDRSEKLFFFLPVSL